MTLTLKGLQPLTRIDTSIQESIDDLSVFLTPQMYAPVGATLGDGTSQPLSDFYASLPLAQVDFSFATALTQETDWACIQKMSYEALGYPTFEHADTNAYLNKPMFIPGGVYQLGADTWLIRNASGVKVTGAGTRATKIFGSGIVFQTDGFWYSQVEAISFETTGAAVAVVDIDGNVPGHPYATRGVQSNIFKDIFVNGVGLATYGFALTRQGNPPGPGAQGSENLFLSCDFNNCVQANWYSTGFNALQNTFIGGNIQGHQKHGIYIIAGSIYLFSVGFQSTNAYTQIVNDGYDINANSGGVGDRITVIGCRTESARFYRGAGSQPPVLISNLQQYGGDVGWFPLTASYYTANKTILKNSVTLGWQMYRVTTAGTSGGDSVTNSDIFSTTTIGKTGKVWTVNQWVGWKVVLIGGTGDGQERNIVSNTATTLTVATWTTTPDATTDFRIEPIWPDSGTFTDGSVVWTMTPVNVIDITGGQLIANAMQFGTVRNLGLMLDSPMREVRYVDTPSYTAAHTDEFLLVDTVSGNVTIILQTDVPIGKRYYIKKYGTDANTITVTQSDTGTLDGETSQHVIPGASRGWVVVEMGGGGNLNRGYFILSKSLGVDPQFRRLRLDQGTTLVVGDFALSAGWGTSASVTFSSVMKDSHGMVTVISAGTGQAANPTLTLTFKDGAWPSTPDAIVCRGPGAQLTVPVSVHSISTTALVIKFNGTPVAGEQYDICFFVLV